MSEGKCPLCGKPATVNASPLFDSSVLQVKCQRCGTFSLVDGSFLVNYVPTVGDKFPQPWQISAFVRERNLLGLPDPILVPTQRVLKDKSPAGSVGLDLIEDMLPKSVAERLDRTLLNLSRMSRFLGDRFKLSSEDYPITFGKTSDEFNFIMSQLATDKLVNIQGIWPGDVQITAKGYNRIAELERGLWGPFSKQAFVAMTFNTDLNDPYKLGIEPAIVDCGYTPLRVDKAEHNEDINDFIIAELRKSKFLVADFTEHRNGVYFEAGFMLGLARPVIFTCRKDQMKDAHFDTSHRNHVLWESAEELHVKLRARIQASIV